jgi:hypothetical protein
MLLLPFLPAAGGAGVGVGTNNPDTKNPFVFNSVLTLNNPSDNPDETYEVVNVAIADQFALQTEPLPQSDGQQSYIPRKVRKLIHIDGIIHAKTLAKLNYMAMQMNRYLDPINAFVDDRGTDMNSNKGFLPLTFSVPTSDTTNYPTGLITCVAYVRSTQRPVQVGSKLQGYNARFQIIFEMIDPRIYYTTQQSVTLNDGSNTDHTSATEYPTFPVLSVTLSSAADVIEITRKTPDDENGNDMVVKIDPTKTLDGTAGGNGDVITLNMANGRAFKNGVLREDWAVPGFMAYWPVVPGTNTFFLDGGSSTFSAKTLTYYRAFP